MIESDQVEEALAHGRAAKAWAEAFVAVENAKSAVFALARTEETDYIEDWVFGVAVARYQAASSRFCRAQEALNEAQSADSRPLCEACFRRLDRGEETRNCAALGYQTSHQIKEKA